ncbi:MAG TPA: hypothetical protein VM123_20180 [archaeon]|nr:hypothetical protein [archaeon]
MTGQSDRALREAILNRLYQAFLEEGLYRGVVSKKTISLEFEAQGVLLERNLEYLLDRGFIRMHKIEDLISITTEGIDWIETGVSATRSGIAASLGSIEQLLQSILKALGDKKES